MAEHTIGLPYPWKFRKIGIRKKTCFFAATSPRTFAFGGEVLQDGFILFLGCFSFGWAKMPGETEGHSQPEAKHPFKTN